MNRIVYHILFVIIIGLALTQASCLSAQQLEGRNVKVVILNAKADQASLVVNGSAIYEGPLGVANESDGISLITDVARSAKYSVEFTYENSHLSENFPEGRNIEVIYIDVGRIPRITFSSNPTLLVD